MTPSPNENLGTQGEQVQTVEDLGKLVKKKYPDYNHLSDVEVGRKVRAKYPDYKNFIDLPDQYFKNRAMTVQAEKNAPPVPSFNQFVEKYVEPVRQVSEDLLGGAKAGIISTGVHGGDIIRQATGQKRIINEPDIQRMMTPPANLAGKIGFGTEQAAEYLAAERAIPEIMGSGWLARGGRIARGAGIGGLVGGAQTGTGTGAAWGAGLGAGGGVAGEIVDALIPKFAGRTLAPAKKYSLEQREDMIARAIRRGEEVPITSKEVKSNFPHLQPEINRNKGLIDQITKDPDSPYSARSIPINQILDPVRDYIQKLARVDPDAAASLQGQVDHWASELGGGTNTTVAEAQRLKEAFGQAIPKSARAEGAAEAARTHGRKLAESGLRSSIEAAIPEETIGVINRVISNDLRLKEAITTAVKRNPEWLDKTIPYVLGETAAGELASRYLPGHEKTARTGEAIAVLATLATRNPAAALRLSLALRRAGSFFRPASALAPAAGAAVRSAYEPAPDEIAPTQLQTPSKPAAPAPQTPPSRTEGPKPPPPSTPAARVTMPQIQRQFLTSTQRANVGKQFKVSPGLLRAQMAVESSGNRNAVSYKRDKRTGEMKPVAYGLMQFTLPTAREFGINPRDPLQSIDAAARKMSGLLERYHGDQKKALWAYNAGEGTVDAYLAGRGFIPQESVQYANRVLGSLRQGD
jgi:soluble lytic murein transglycosylase-like protein